MADQRCSPSVLTAASWAARQAGNDFLDLSPAFRCNRQLHASTAPAAIGRGQTIALQWPEVSNECRALDAKDLAQFRHGPTFPGLQRE